MLRCGPCEAPWTEKQLSPFWFKDWQDYLCAECRVWALSVLLKDGLMRKMEHLTPMRDQGSS